MRALLLPLPLLLLAACGGAAEPPAIPSAKGLVQTPATMLVYDDGTSTRLCPGGIAREGDCRGPVITNWHGKLEKGPDGTRFGEFHVVGRFDGTRLTVTKATPLDDFDGPEAEKIPVASPACQEPSTGWEIPKPDLVDFEGAMAALEELPDYGSAALDRVSKPGESDLGDPHDDVFVAAVTDDLERAERVARQHWGGRLCVVRAKHGKAELDQVEDELQGVPGRVSAVNLGDVVELYVLYDDGRLARWADEEFGKGVVRIRTVLVPAS